MSNKARLSHATMGKITLLIAAAVTVMLISDITLAPITLWDEPRNIQTAFLLFAEGVVFIFVGALFSVSSSDTPQDVALESWHRGVPMRPEPIREGYGKNERDLVQVRTGTALLIIGAILIVVGFIVFRVV